MNGAISVVSSCIRSAQYRELWSCLPTCYTVGKYRELPGFARDSQNTLKHPRGCRNESVVSVE